MARPKRLGITGTIKNVTKTGRNQLCLCGSGLKYKNCHGKESYGKLLGTVERQQSNSEIVKLEN